MSLDCICFMSEVYIFDNRHKNKFVMEPWDTLLWLLYMGMKHFKCSNLSILSPTKSCLIHLCIFIYLFIFNRMTGNNGHFKKSVSMYAFIHDVYMCVRILMRNVLCYTRFPFSHEYWIRKGMLWACIAPWLPIKLLQKQHIYNISNVGQMWDKEVLWTIFSSISQLQAFKLSIYKNKPESNLK